MQPSVWKEFVMFFEKTKTSMPIVSTSLRQLRPLELTNDRLILSCENSGTKFFLDKKIGVVEEGLAEFLKRKVAVQLVVGQNTKKPLVEAPLLSFKPSIQDVFVRVGLYEKYRFNNFVMSSTNQVAYAACRAVAKNPGEAYNPLFLYGGVGVGKTHLAQAVAREILELDPEKKAFFCPGDQFTNELIEAIRDRSTQRFRKKYRQLNLLIIDDIQFIAGKEHIQEEFFHTFNSVASAGGQIILTSDKPPTAIKNLEDRLRSRFSGGLIIDIQLPDFELRSAILLVKAKEKGIIIDINAARIIAERISDSRALEGTLLSIYAQTLGKKEGIDLEEVDVFFHKKEEKQTKRISSHDIVKAVCSHYNVKQSQIKAPTRRDNIAFPRQIIMYLLRRELNLKYDEVAYLLKRKDHTTVMHGEDKISDMMIKNPLFKQEIDRIVSTLNS